MRRMARYAVGVTAVLAGLMAGCATTNDVPAVDPAPSTVLSRVADFVLTDFPEPPPFNWGEGVLMAGMMRAGQATGDERYMAFVRAWADHWHHVDIGPILEMRGYCGRWGPGFPVLMLYEETREDAYLDMGMQIVDFMEGAATRTTDGGLGHWRDNKQLWVDTLYMSCPVYTTAGRLKHQSGLIDEAARQLDISATHLQDQGTGLFYHMYDEPKGTHTPEPWGRGNGWTAMAYIETLRHLPPFSARREDLERQFKRLAAGLVECQDKETGLWHTVLTRPDSYLETSATAMILFSLVEGHRLGIIELKDSDLAQRGWSGLVSRIEENGRVVGVSAGTGPTDYTGYMGIAQGTETWGTGAVLLAGSALMASD